MHFLQHLKAPNNRQGNPRRLFILYDTFGEVSKVYDEGYTGKPLVSYSAELPEINIPASEYVYLRRWAKEANKWVEA